jgi:hypothetical protein
MSWIPWAIGLAGAGYVYKKKPEWLPKALRPAAADKRIAALHAVKHTSSPTPSATAGMDPNMATAEVAAANGLLSGGTDSAAMYAMASDYSEKGYTRTAEALIAKADAISAAQKHGADDASLLAQMNAATTAGEAASATPGVSTPGSNFFSNLFK